MLPGTAESYWIDSTPTTAYPPLAGDIEADVAVVGGGIAGICTAWELAAAGRAVVLLEADSVAAGVTGYTTAKLSALHTLIYAKLRASFGRDAARLYAHSQQQAVHRVEAVASQLEIECDLEFVPAYTYVESPDQLDRIHAEVDAAREAGLTVATEGGSRVTAGQVVVATHYPVFDRAMLFARLKPRRELVVAAAIP